MIITNAFEGKEKLPMLQYLHNVSKANILREYYQVARKRRISYLYHRCPEAQGPIDGHARDICGSYHFEPISNTSSGKIKVNRAKRFDELIDYKKRRLAMIKDALITGEGFSFKSKVPLDMAERMKSAYAQLGDDFTDLEYGIADVVPVASTTMSVQHDDHRVTGYMQTLLGVSGDKGTISYPKDKIMHLTFDTPAGKVEGWTPLYSLPLHMELLWLLWSNQYDFQERGNHPDMVVMAETLKHNSAAFKKIENDLKSYNQPGNSKHGTLLLSDSKFTIEQLERMDTLQFKEVGMFISSLIASVLHYPQTRLSIKTEQSSKDKDPSGGSEKFYYNIVSQKQAMFNDLENRDIWVPYFGVRLVQDKSYLHDQVEEGTAQQLRMGNLVTLSQQLSSLGYVLPPGKVLDIFNNRDTTLDESDISEGQMMSDVKSPLGDKLSNQQAMNQGMSTEDRVAKRTTEIQRESQQGKPTGT